VEQFDTLSPHDTAREAIEFSAALRLASAVSPSRRQSWVDSVLEMLELKPLENTMVGQASQGGMSFEQKKRVSIGIELAANPSIIFLDEPTTGIAHYMTLYSVVMTLLLLLLLFMCRGIARS
jgi:ABC-type multidrug transport system ATPase subunit